MRNPNCIRRRLLRISAQCYAPHEADAICRWSLIPAGGRNPEECSLKQDSALVGSIDLDGEGKAIVVAFRGTLARLGSDEARTESALDCAQIPFTHPDGRPQGKVHRGFLEAVNNVWKDEGGRQGVGSRLQRLIDEHADWPIYVTGHSKGGAMANIVALKIVDRWPHAKVRVVTFAGARPGDAAFAAEYAARVPNSVRYESWPDLVPELPPGGVGSWWLRTVIAPLLRIGKLKDLRIADLDPFYPVGTRVPAGNWMGDGARRGLAAITGLFGYKISPRKLILAHAIAPGTSLDELVCSDAGVDRCDHR